VTDSSETAKNAKTTPSSAQTALEV